MATTPTPKSIDEYIGRFPENVQTLLQDIRKTIHETAPEAQETISYKMPAFNLHGQGLVYFAGYFQHIGFYPAPTGVPEFAGDIAEYGYGKGTLQFSLDKPIPHDLIRRVVAYRMQEIQARKPAKAKS